MHPTQEQNPETGGARGFRYWAFISYSQRDAAVAAKLHEFLETYRIPRALVGRIVNGWAIPARLLPVFRDRDELAGSPDLGAILRESLTASGALIAICSPHAAASQWVGEEIRAFKAMGRADRVFALVVAGEPNASDTPASAQAECFPLTLRREVTSGGVVTDRRVEPLAADAREDKDGWKNACLKIVAGILGVGFDDLKRRDAQRQRRQRIVRAVVSAAAAVAIMLGYVALADDDVAVPGGEFIRNRLDRYGVSVFRPVPDQNEMASLARAMRTSLRGRLLVDVASGKIEQEQPLSAWTIGEVVSAGFRDRETPAEDLRGALRLIDALFRPAEPNKPEGYRLMETADDVGNPGRAEPIFWTIMALSTVLARSDALKPVEREHYERYLAIAQTVAESFYPHEDGGWNTASRQVNPGGHYIYTTALALHMLLELRAANLGWLGRNDKRDRMIAETAAWLQRAFVKDAVRPGWRRSLDDDKPPDTGITLLAHSALARACADAGITLANDIGGDALRLNADLRRRSYESADPDIRYDVRIYDANGAAKTQVTVTRMIWFPWAVQGLTSGRICAEKGNVAPEIRRALDRSLGHLLGSVAPDMLRDVLRPERPLWVGAETYYGVGTAP